MTNHAGEKIVCRQCHALLDADDRFCRQCGASTAEAILLCDAGEADLPKRSLSAMPDRSDRRSPWSGNVWVVLTMLFVALGPLALPMLWQSRQFSLFWKIVLTVLVGIITVVNNCLPLVRHQHDSCAAETPVRALSATSHSPLGQERPHWVPSRLSGSA